MSSCAGYSVVMPPDPTRARMPTGQVARGQCRAHDVQEPCLKKEPGQAVEPSRSSYQRASHRAENEAARHSCSDGCCASRKHGKGRRTSKYDPIVDFEINR